MSFTRSLAVTALSFAILTSANAQAPKRKKLLVIGEVKGFEHDSVSHAMAMFEKLGQESGIFDAYLRTDSELITKQKLTKNAKNLDYFDAIVFYTTGELDLNDEQKAALLSFIKDDGKGFLGMHSATDTFYNWPEYGQMIGGYFDNHPWHKEVKIKIEDHSFPGMKQFPDSITLNDEIYQFRNYSRNDVRVLMSLDTSSVDLTDKRVKRTDKDFAVTWAKNYGKGRVFYSSLGHENAVLDRKDIQEMWLGAIKWAMGMVPGDASPRPGDSH
ncbi:MAG: ThuA domain-containing protein [Acidobacteriota bacterium]|nr:ThuA domain-containing protein [Acidobacteriota bacterium]